MKNKLNLNEGEIQRILSLHKNAILKESGQNILNEENTFTLPTSSEFKASSVNPSSGRLKLYKGTKFKVAKNIKNSLITTRKVTANFTAPGSAHLSTSYEDNKAFVVYNCKTKNFYLIGSTNEGAKQEKDYSSNKKAIWKSGGNYKSLDNLCLETTVRDEVVVKPKDAGTENPKLGNEKGNQELGNEKDTLVVAGTSGTKYTFDFETIMKAIDDTGKCPRSGTSDGAGASGTSGSQGTQGTSGAPVVIQKPTITKDDFYQWTMD